MEKFLELEGGYLVIAFIILAVTLFVATRPFVKASISKALLIVGFILSIFIGLHYKVTTDRMAEVKLAFSEGKTIVCESRMQRKIAQSIDVSKDREWRLEGDLFTSPNYSRPFHTARCLVK